MLVGIAEKLIRSGFDEYLYDLVIHDIRVKAQICLRGGVEYKISIIE